MKKIISLLSALAIFSSMAVTSFAAVDPISGENVPGADSQPKVQAWVADADDSDGYVNIYFKVINNETLSYQFKQGKYKSNGINAFQITANLDTDVFDTSDTWCYAHDSLATTGGSPFGDESDYVGMTFFNAAIIGYITNVPEYVLMVETVLKDGYTLDNIPADAVEIGECAVEYMSYDGSKKYSEDKTCTTYTIYGNDKTVAAGGYSDYDLAYKFTGTSTEWPADDDNEGEGEETAEAMAAGVLVEEGVYAGMTSASTDVVAADELVKIVISNDVDTSKTLTWNAPATLGEGKSNVLAVLLYDATAMKDSTFTVKFLGAADALIKAFTHIVE